MVHASTSIDAVRLLCRCPACHMLPLLRLSCRSSCEQSLLLLLRLQPIGLLKIRQCRMQANRSDGWQNWSIVHEWTSRQPGILRSSCRRRRCMYNTVARVSVSYVHSARSGKPSKRDRCCCGSSRGYLPGTSPVLAAMGSREALAVTAAPLRMARTSAARRIELLLCLGWPVA